MKPLPGSVLKGDRYVVGGVLGVVREAEAQQRRRKVFRDVFALIQYIDICASGLYDYFIPIL